MTKNTTRLSVKFTAQVTLKFHSALQMNIIVTIKSKLRHVLGLLIADALHSIIIRPNKSLVPSAIV